MEWHSYLDIFMLQVYTINLCIISKGMPTNGIQGFVRHIFTAIKDIKPSHVAICWDMGQATFRNAMYTSYKQNRPAPPEELIPQFDYKKTFQNNLVL